MSNLPASIYYPTYKDVPWPLASGAQWYIEYDVGSNGLISYVYEYAYIPVNGGEYYQWYIPIPSQYSNYWYRSNVVWAGIDEDTVYFNPGGSGQFFYSSSGVLSSGPLANNTAESSNVAYTQMMQAPPYTGYQLYQDFQT